VSALLGLRPTITDGYILGLSRDEARVTSSDVVWIDGLYPFPLSGAWVEVSSWLSLTFRTLEISVSDDFAPANVTVMSWMR
jgi:hypothetical protein